MDDNGVVVWEWDGREPFGFQMPNQDPDGDSNYFYLNMRFAGQWFDYETGLYHNGFRDYHPKAGRYIQSDPIGLEGGWNTYAYTEKNSVNFVDTNGRKMHFISEGPKGGSTGHETIVARELGLPARIDTLSQEQSNEPKYQIYYDFNCNIFNFLQRKDL